MSNKAFYLSVAALLVAVSSFAEQERVIRIQNHLRFGIDDNIYVNETEKESAEVIDVLNISGKMNFSSRTDAVFSYQPEVRYRFDGDPKTLTFHDAYGKLNHALSQRVFMTLSDRFSYKQRNAQAGVVSSTDNNYAENDLMGALDIALNSLSSLKLGAGYEFRTWDDDNYGETLGNNYDTYTGSASVFRELGKATTQGMLGFDYEATEYDGPRGNLDVATFMAGADHIFNPNVTGFGRLGASMVSTDTQIQSDDSTTPYLDVGMDYNPTERTSLNGGVAYSAYRAQNSLYNKQDRTSFSLGLRHDLTAKISLATSLAYIMSAYEGSTATTVGSALLDVDDEYLQLNLRGSYQINRNNFVELGYEFTDRSVGGGALSEYQRNRVDIGWRLRL